MIEATSGGIPPGTQLNNIYQIVRRIGVGGMGEVYEAREIHSGNPVAIKVILPELARDQMVLDLFKREASVLNKLHHEAIVGYSVFTVDPQLQRPYLAMQFAYGPSLRERLRRGRPLSDDEFESLRKRMAGGLDAAHKLGIIHRDISPDNIVLVDDDVAKSKIIDFGIAKAAGEEKTILGDQFAGKMSYASPEQVGLGDGQVTDKTDVYALGIVFAEAVTTKPMIMGGSSQLEGIEKRKRVPDLSHVPEKHRDLIAAMLDPNPARRPTMADVVEWEPGRTKRRGGGFGRFLRTALLGLIGMGAAMAVVAVLWFFVLGVTELDPPSADPITAKAGQAGERYSWESPAFIYSGDLSELRLETKGALPAGLTVSAGNDGTVTVSGTPKSAVSTTMEIVATAPDGTSASQKITFSVEPAPNAAPQVTDSPGGAIQLIIGKDFTRRVGSFSDDSGPAALKISVAGAVPNGVTVSTGSDGSVGLSGTPREDGEFPFEIIATDADGASARFAVSLVVIRPRIDLSDPGRQVVAQANRKACFFVRILQLVPGTARLEAFGAEVAPMHELDRDFKARAGYEAKIRGRKISAQQCRIVDTLGLLDFAMLEHDASMRVPNEQPARGELVKGLVKKGADALLFLIDEQGRGRELEAQTAIVGQDLEFQTRLTGRGPQLIVAAIPIAPGALAGARTLQDIARPSMRGRVKLVIAHVSVR